MDVTDHWSLLVAGGTVIDPTSGLHAPLDVAIAGNRIVEIGPRLNRDLADSVINADGCIVTPGLIDLHVHSYYGVNVFGANVDPVCQATGVTTAVDAGSSGSVNFGGFKQFVAATSTTRALGFVCVAKHGVTTTPGELVDLAYADPSGAANAVSDNRDVAVGIKVRLSGDKVGSHGRDALQMAIDAAEESDSPVMVHIGATRQSIEEILDMLRPGDIVTHCYTPHAPTFIDESGTIRPAAIEAHERGVLFDVGHGGGNLDFDVARICMDAGLAPDVISTDIHRGLIERGASLSLPLAMSKFLALGMTIDEVVERCTSGPARSIRWQDRLGAIAPGREADLAVLRLRASPVVFEDTAGKTLAGDQLVEAAWTIRSGEAHHCAGE